MKLMSFLPLPLIWCALVSSLAMRMRVRGVHARLILAYALYQEIEDERKGKKEREREREELTTKQAESAEWLSDTRLTSFPVCLVLHRAPLSVCIKITASGACHPPYNIRIWFFVAPSISRRSSFRIDYSPKNVFSMKIWLHLIIDET